MMRLTWRTRKAQEQGFTIVELMIATTIMTVLLLLATAIFTALGGDYVKSAQLVNAQNAARGIMESISRELQFSSDKVYFHAPSNTAGTISTPGHPGTLGAVNALCIGTTRYSYVIGNQETSPSPYSDEKATPEALWQDTMATPAGNASDCTTVDVTSPLPGGTQGKELVPPRDRLTGLCVAPVSGSTSEYQIDVWVAYGDDYLLGPATGTADPCGDRHHYCLNGSGQQYCATAELETVVTRRVSQ